MDDITHKKNYNSDKMDKLYSKINNLDKTVVFFGLSYCEYCKKTLNLLNKHKISYKYYSIDKYRNIFFDLLKKISEMHPSINIDINQKTFPVIFIKKKFIGTYTNFEKIIKLGDF